MYYYIEGDGKKLNYFYISVLFMFNLFIVYLFEFLL